MQAIITRMKQPSTWAAIAALLPALGLPLTPAGTEVFIYLGTGISGALGIILMEKS